MPLPKHATPATPPPKAQKTLPNTPVLGLSADDVKKQQIKDFQDTIDQLKNATKFTDYLESNEILNKFLNTFHEQLQKDLDELKKQENSFFDLINQEKPIDNKTAIEKFISQAHTTLLSFYKKMPIVIFLSQLFEGESSEVLNFIRLSVDSEFNCINTFPSKTLFFHKLNSGFCGSQRLFIFSILRHFNIGIQKKYKVIQGTLEYPEELIIRKKKNGKQMGFIAKIKDQTKSNTYFIKTYRHYPITAEQAGTEIQLNHSSANFSYSKEQIKPLGQIIDLKEPFTYKAFEFLNIGAKVDFHINPYIRYGFLNIGAKVDFHINPYIRYGFYIISEEIPHFIEIGELNSIYKTNESFMNGMESLEQFKKDITLNPSSITEKQFIAHLNRKVIVSLTEFDIINRIFTIGDFNDGNIGLIDDPKQKTENEDHFFNETHNFKIVDFTTTEQNYNNFINDNIFYEFISGNNSYLSNSILDHGLYRIPKGNSGSYAPNDLIQQEKYYFGYGALLEIQRKIEKAFNTISKSRSTQEETVDLGEVSSESSNEESKSKEEEMETIPPLEKLKDIKIIIPKLQAVLDSQIKSIQDLLLQKRNDHPVLDNRTNAELLGFSSETKFTGEKRTSRKASDKLELEYIEDSIEDLYKYRDGILVNLETLQRHIEEGYQKYFNHN